MGKWPLAIDEYYIIKSVENILNSGLPQWSNGEFYFRGLIMQYLTAVLLISGLKAEFASRIIPVILNILSIIPLYILAKKVSGKFSASLIILIFCFSLWEVEFARFARMYVPLQTIFIFYILFLYNYLIENKIGSLKWIFILSFISIFIHEASVFLSVLNLLILFWDKDKKEFKLNLFNNSNIYPQIFLCLFIIGGAYFFNTGNFRELNSVNLFPHGFTDSHSHLFNKPFFNRPLILLTTLPDNIIWVIPFLLITGFTVFSIIKFVTQSEKDLTKKLLISLILLLSLINLFALLVLIVMIYLLLNWLSISDLKKKEMHRMISAVIINAFFWAIFVCITNDWYKFFQNFEPTSMGAIFKKIFVIFFDFPDIYYNFLIYFNTVPVQSIIFIISLPAVFLYSINNEYYSSLNLRFILLIFLMLILAVSSIDTALMETRYTFFLYPIVLLMFVYSFKILTDRISNNNLNQKITFSIITSIYVFFAGDFSLKHLMNIDSEEYNFRMVYDEDLTRHYYPRWDVKTPAEFVNKEASADDIIIIDEFNLEFYLNRIDYAYVNYNNPDFIIFSTNGGRNERWTNAPLIYTNQQLMDVIKTAKKNVWFVTILKPELDEINFRKNFGNYLHYQSIDKSIFVYKIPGGTEINSIKK